MVEQEAFVPYCTIFKLEGESATVPGKRPVVCQNCGAAFVLEELLTGELREEQCPACEMTGWEYYAGKPHREVPDVY